MANFVRKTYDNSYLFNKESIKHQKHLAEYIIKSQRIEKNSDAFRGIVEDVKRFQNSSILYTVLMMDDVVLCINSTELPRAFKVFSANDLRVSSKTPKVFIDVTGLITFKDNYFTCKKPDVLISYLFAALCYLIYNKEPIKMINNSNISISGTECFVSMFTYIIDYLRIIGYSNNKEKIMYFTGLYFLHHMMGKDLDNYTKNIAAKVAGLTPNDIKAFDLYYDEEDFDGIYSFVTFISDTFKLKDLTPEVFISKWLFLFSTGTQFATELFTSFAVVIVEAYCGSYINNQKQIERCCGASMVKFATSVLKLGTDVFDNRAYMSESELDKTIARDKVTMELREAFLNKGKLPDDAQINYKDIFAKSNIVAARKIVKHYTDNKQNGELSKEAAKIMRKYLDELLKIYKDANVTDYSIPNDTTENIFKTFYKYLGDKDKSDIAKKLDKLEIKCQSRIEDLKDDDKKKSSLYAKLLVEVRSLKKYV